MESKHAHSANRSYEDFDPLFTWHREEGRDSLELHLPGFRRDQIRIQINHLGFLVISGERAVDGTRWRRFKKEFEIPSYCNEEAIHGNFMQSILSVVMPKKKSLQVQETQISRTEEKEKEKEKKTNKNVTFREHGTNEEIETTAKGTIEEDTYHQTTEYQFEDNDDVKLTPETTREVAFKFMVVMIVILIIASYLADISKSLVTEAQSYFHN